VRPNAPAQPAKKGLLIGESLSRLPHHSKAWLDETHRMAPQVSLGLEMKGNHCLSIKGRAAR